MGKQEFEDLRQFLEQDAKSKRDMIVPLNDLTMTAAGKIRDESHDGLTLSDYAMGQTLSRTMVVLPSRELRQTLTRQEVVGVRETPELEYPFDRVAPTHLCDQCGAIAKVNMHMDQGEIIDFFYECKCGNIIEGEDA